MSTVNLIALKGAPLSIIVFMHADPRPTGPVQLAAATGYSRFTVSAGLRRLESMQLVRRLPARFESWERVREVENFYLAAPIYNYYYNNENEGGALAEILQMHTEEIGAPTAAIRAKLAALIERHSDLEHWRDAYTAAAVHNKRSLAYVIKCVQSRGTLTDSLRRQTRLWEDSTNAT